MFLPDGMLHADGIMHYKTSAWIKEADKYHCDRNHREGKESWSPPPPNVFHTALGSETGLDDVQDNKIIILDNKRWKEIVGNILINGQIK